MVDTQPRYTIRLDDWMYEILEERARSAGRTVDQVVTALIGRALYTQPHGFQEGAQMTSTDQAIRPVLHGDNEQAHRVNTVVVPDAQQLDRVDTVVVAAHPNNFEGMFLEGHWSHIQMSEAMQQQVKFIAAYQTKTRSITHMARIARIEPRLGQPGESDHVVLYFDTPQQIAPVPFGQGRGQAIQGRQYTNRARLLMARSLGDLRTSSNWQPTRQGYVRSLITQLLQETPELVFDQTWTDYIRLAYPAWDQDVDPMLGPATWSAIGRMLLFTLDNLPDHLTINFMIGPGPDAQREYLLQLADHEPLGRFPEQDVTNAYGKWTVLYIHQILDPTLFAKGTDAEIEEALKAFWADFRTNTLPAINAAVESIR